MKQVFLSGKGEIEVMDVPVPGRLSNAVLVKNAFSVISTGTEGAAVSRRGGWLGVIEKAAHSKDRVQQVWDMAQSQGFSQTWDLVRNKLGDFTAPGYSCAGQVVEVANEEMSFRPGDLVSCFGVGFATHSEYVVMPANLVAPLPEGVQCAEAAFGAMACIAIQGIRRLELQPGECVGVIGLGLIGQIAAQLLGAMGYRAVGMDLSAQRAAKAKELAGMEAWGGQETDSVHRVRELTNGQGLDGVLICAATSSDQVVNQAFDLCRRRGRVSLIGDVGLGLQRAKMYQKELELRMSTSYGPGRYDDEYEMRGRDYPLAYVRWTEGRNLEYFLHLLQQKRLNLEPLISYRCPVNEAASGYARIKQPGSDTYGVVIDYGPLPETPQLPKPEAYVTRHNVVPKIAPGIVRVGLIGCGGFAKAVHIPNLSRLSSLFEITGVATRTGGTAEVVARKAGAAIATSDYRVLLDNKDINAVVISTRHASHARMVLDALEAGKHVFVEKPMCITIEEGEKIIEKARETGLVVRVGFNRRFAPALNAMRKGIGTQGARLFTCRVNIGSIANDWSNTPEEGGRLLGEGVHFFDLCNWFMGGEPEKVEIASAGKAEATNPNVLVQLCYPKSCVAQVLYTDLGHRGLGKEYYEAFGNGRAARCADFKHLEIFGAPAGKNKKAQGGKGHREELEEFAAAIRGDSYPVQGADAQAGLVATRIALQIHNSH